SGGARFTAHTSFTDPTSPPNAKPRESIEIRTLAFFDP
ncbi:MAG TPA: methyltransferase, partial [Rhodospirillales bacterium]|nr:methyltransferase [Rhodospirillales bacterium]